MSVEHLLPFAGDHAVQNAAIALEWQGELSDQTLLRIYSLAEKLKPSFDKVELQKLMMINLADTGPSKHTDGLGGVQFQKMTSLGTASRQMIVSRGNCTFIVHDYSRWVTMLEDAIRCLQLIMPVILADKAINAIGLQYTDAFTWKEDPADLNMKDVFREDTGLVPAHALNLKHLWHNHHGYLENVTEPVPHVLTTNVNVTVQDVSGERMIQIITTHRATLEKPIRLSTSAYFDVVANIENHLHSRNKSLLSQLLSEDVSNKINLNAKG